MPIINIFNSHRWKQDSSENIKIREWLRDDYYYSFKFYEVSKQDFDEGNGILTSGIKAKIDLRLQLSTVVLAFNNQSISYNDSSVHAYEIKKAIEMRKPIVLINKYATSETPAIYRGYQKLKMTNWNSNSIREAIKEARFL